MCPFPLASTPLPRPLRGHRVIEAARMVEARLFSRKKQNNLRTTNYYILHTPHYSSTSTTTATTTATTIVIYLIRTNHFSPGTFRSAQCLPHGPLARGRRAPGWKGVASHSAQGASTGLVLLDVVGFLGVFLAEGGSWGVEL